MTLTAQEKQAIVASLVAGESRKDTAFELYESSGRRVDSWQLGTYINASDEITSALQQVKDYVRTNIASIVTLTDDVEEE